MGFRDDTVIVIDTGSLTTRAILGLAESMTPPQVRVPTKVGVIKPSGDEQQTQYLFDEELEQAETQKVPGLEIIRPVVAGKIADWDVIEIFWFGSV
jgi:actin-related protein 9